ncbi:MAG: TonB-dependent receptor [bacterium]
MKICSLWVLLFLILSPVYSLAQNFDRKISVELKDTSLREAIRIIGEIGNIYFSYNPATIPVGRRITFQTDEKTIREILNELLLKNGITWEVVESQVVLRPVNEKEIKSGKEIRAELPRFTVSGFVKDSKSGEVLIGATIHVKGTSTGAVTNGYGFYSLTMPVGSYTLAYGFLGYDAENREVILDENQKISVEMTEARMEIQGVEIHAVTDESDIRYARLSEVKLTPKNLAQMPGFAGNIDIIRALQSVPGIQTYGDGSANYYVRGGNSDQNLLLIDEAPIYNPSHLFGFYSALTPDAINDVQVYKGDFPVRYGGRLSSVIDVKGREGNMKKYGFSGNVGPYASYLSVEGPIVKDRASFFISGRLSTLNWLNTIISGVKNFDFTFYDINAKLNFRLNGRDRFFFTFYTGNDNFSRIINSAFRTYGIRWNNMVGTFRWNHVFNNRFFLNTTANYSQYRYWLFISETQDDYWRSSISNLTLKSDLTWFLNPENTLKAGVEVSLHNSDPGNVTLVESNGSAPVPQVANYHSVEYDLYLGNEQHIGKKLTLRYGIRLPVWQDIGPTTLYYFDGNYRVIDTAQISNMSSYDWFFSPEPRFGLNWAITEKSELHFSYTRTTQFLQILSNSTGPFTSLDVWAPSGPNIKPQRADQVTLGYFRKIAKSKLNLSAEIFYKYFYNHMDYCDHANLLYNPLIEGELRQGRAWSYGLEIMLRKPVGKFTGWIGYTFSRAFNQTEGVNNGKVYRASYDRPNDVSLNFSYNDQKHWAFSANWIYMTGGTITTPIGFYNFDGYSIPVYGEKNNDRLPDYHRLDLSATYTFNKPGNRYQHSLTLTLYNAYGRLNPFSVNFNKVMDDNGNIVVPSNLDGQYERIPTTISVAGIIPSINYLFKF